MSDAGYSGTPLGKKLGYREGMRVFVDGMPEAIRDTIEESISEKPDWQLVREANFDAAHIFVTERAALQTTASALAPMMGSSRFLWSVGRKRPRRCPPTSPKTRSAKSACRSASST